MPFPNFNLSVVCRKLVEHNQPTVVLRFGQKEIPRKVKLKVWFYLKTSFAHKRDAKTLLFRALELIIKGTVSFYANMLSDFSFCFFFFFASKSMIKQVDKKISFNLINKWDSN